MSSFRRWYFYVVAAFSLQAVTWAAIALLRNLLLPAIVQETVRSPDAGRIAFQIAVILVGLPTFLLHWRRAQDAQDGRGAPERSLYLLFMLSAFLAPLLTNAVGLLQALLRLITDTVQWHRGPVEWRSDPATLVYCGAAVLVLGLMIAYHARLLQEARAAEPRDAAIGTLYRLFIYLFSAVGLAMTAASAANLLGNLFAAGSRPLPSLTGALINQLALLLAGCAVWLSFWLAAQRLYRYGGRREEGSALRKIYLYAALLAGVLSAVAAATALLAGFFRALLDVPAAAGGGAAMAALVVGSVVCAYHALVLHEDAAGIPLPAGQAGLRRLALYLVAGVGLVALLAGLGGVLGVLLDPNPYVVTRQREQFAWFAATLLAGLGVWVVPWRRCQQACAQPGAAGATARASLVRRFYLYFFLLLATLTVLITAIFILSRLLALLLGDPLGPSDGRDMALAASYLLIAALVWLYHALLLRADNAVLAAQEGERAARTRVLVVDDGDGRLGCRLLEELRRAMPELQLTALGLTDSATAALRGGEAPPDAEQIIAAADIIAGPWSIAAPHAGLTADEQVQAAIAASPARKIILPRPAPGWQWAGVPVWDSDTAVAAVAAAVQDLVAGELAAARLSPGPGLIILLLAATLIILLLLTTLLGSVLPLFG